MYWTTEAQYPTAIAQAQSGVSGGLVYISGGYDGSSTALTALRTYNPTTKVYTTKASDPSSAGAGGRMRGAGSTGPTTFTVAAGIAYNTTGWLNARVYTISSNTWSAAFGNSGWFPDDFLGACSHQGTGTMFFCGGTMVINGGSSTLAAIMTTSGTFTQKANLPSGRYCHSVTVESSANNGVYHIVSGYDPNSNLVTTHYAYTASSNTYATKAAFPIATTQASGAMLGGIYAQPILMGGAVASGTNDHVYTYAPTTNTWTTQPSLPQQRYAPVAAAPVQNYAWSFGGTYPFNPDKEVFRLVVSNPPNAPTNLTPAASGTFDPSLAKTFSWTFSDPDAGDIQSAYAIKFQDISAGTAAQWWNATTQAWQATEVFNTSTSASVTIPANSFTLGDTYQWQVATIDTLGPTTGPYSAAQLVSATTAPTTAVLGPIGTMTGTTSVGQPIYWSYNGATAQAFYRVKVFTAATVNAGGFNPETSVATLYDSGQVASAATSLYLPVSLADNGDYYAYVKVAAAGPNWSAWARHEFFTNYTAPLGGAVRLGQTVEYVYQQLTTQVGRPVPDVDADAAVQNSAQPIIRLALGATDYTPNGTESGGVLPGEISNGGTLDSAVAGAISHTTGVNSFTLQQNWTADQPYVVYTVGVLNNLPYRMALGQPDYIAGSSNKRRLVFAFRLPNVVVAGVGDSFETDVTVTF